MQKWFSLTVISLLVLNACSREDKQFIQSHQSASDAVAASVAQEVAMMASAASATAASAVGSASAASAASGAASGAASAVAASSASAVAASAASAASGKEILKTKKVVIEKDSDSGLVVYYFPESIKKEGKLFHVLTERRFDKPQKLPSSGKVFQYSVIKEAVDCQRRLTDPISTIHFSAKNERVEAHEFPYPDYDKWTDLELQALADEHPDSAFITAVCHLAKGK